MRWGLETRGMRGLSIILLTQVVAVLGVKIGGIEIDKIKLNRAADALGVVSTAPFLSRLSPLPFPTIKSHIYQSMNTYVAT